MFKCQISGKISKPGEKPFRIVTKTRAKTYVNKRKVGEKLVELVTTGWEIAEERVVCKEIYDNYNGIKYL